MIGRADHNGQQGDGINEDVSFTLNTTDRHAVVYGISPYHSNCMKSDNPHSGYYEADTARTLDALQCGYPGCNQGGMAVVEPAYCIGNGQVDQLKLSEKVGALNCMHDQQAVLHSVEEPIVIDRAFFNQGKNALYEPQCYEDGTVPTLVARGPSAVAHGVDCRNATEYENQTGSLQSSACHNMNSNNVIRVKHIVRRLTPLECERLQGFPDGWTDIGEWIDSKGKKHKEADSPRYKALGNSIALPPWKWVLKRLCACYERDATMASLFDGIGGFPYIWEQLNGKGSCLWASEIEEFPMAVTKLRFGGNDNV
jgi:DNA (cytosine-5)-methyltransferase 1